MSQKPESVKPTPVSHASSSGPPRGQLVCGRAVVVLRRGRVHAKPEGGIDAQYAAESIWKVREGGEGGCACARKPAAASFSPLLASLLSFAPPSLLSALKWWVSCWKARDGSSGSWREAHPSPLNPHVSRRVPVIGVMVCHLPKRVWKVLWGREATPCCREQQLPAQIRGCPSHALGEPCGTS